MNEGFSLGPLLTFIALFLFFLLSSRAENKKRQKRRRPPAIPPKEPVQPPPPPSIKVVKASKPIKREALEVKVESSYGAKKKTGNPLLSKDWSSAKNLKEAFILSEILQRVDERDL